MANSGGPQKGNCSERHKLINFLLVIFASAFALYASDYAICKLRNGECTTETTEKAVTAVVSFVTGVLVKSPP
jgi:hypothetical protein